MAEQLREPFEKFVDWREYAAVMQRGITAAHSHLSSNFSNGPRVTEASVHSDPSSLSSLLLLLQPDVIVF
jgi:hypothetical protein